MQAGVWGLDKKEACDQSMVYNVSLKVKSAAFCFSIIGVFLCVSVCMCTEEVKMDD